MRKLSFRRILIRERRKDVKAFSPFVVRTERALHINPSKKELNALRASKREGGTFKRGIIVATKRGVVQGGLGYVFGPLAPASQGVYAMSAKQLVPISGVPIAYFHRRFSKKAKH